MHGNVTRVCYVRTCVRAIPYDFLINIYPFGLHGDHTHFGSVRIFFNATQMTIGCISREYQALILRKLLFLCISFYLWRTCLSTNDNVTIATANSDFTSSKNN